MRKILFLLFHKMIHVEWFDIYFRVINFFDSIMKKEPTIGKELNAYDINITPEYLLVYLINESLLIYVTTWNENFILNLIFKTLKLFT